MFGKLASNRIMIMLSFLMGTFIIYPNINNLLWRHQTVDCEYCIFFVFRFLFFCMLIWILLSINILKTNTLHFPKRLLLTLAITLAAYSVYVCISLMLSTHKDCFTGMLLFQFVVTCLLCTLTGHVSAMYSEHKRKELEIEHLKSENLQSRYNALRSQINPHFLFNSLNSITALVRDENKEKTLEYIHKLSGIFRYILQSDKKGLVAIGEELEFLEALRYIFEIRYADKLKFRIEVDETKHDLKIPVLSFLPPIENIVKHNVIDSDNFMTVSIVLTAENELIISNPVHEKLQPSTGNGIGLSNLSERFCLLTGREIKIEEKNEIFRVILPLSD